MKPLAMGSSKKCVCDEVVVPEDTKVSEVTEVSEMKYYYDGDTIEEIITSHDTHYNYKDFKIFYRGEEINLKEVEVIVYQEEKI